MKKSLLSISLIVLLSLGLSSCDELSEVYGEGGTGWIEEGGDRPTGHLGEDEDETTKESGGDDESLAHTEHTYVLVPDETDPSSGHYSVCSVCGEVESSQLIEHTFTYTDNEDGTHTKVCECGYLVSESHTLSSEYTDNGDGTHSTSCECGYTVSENHIYSSLDDKTCSVCGHIESSFGLSLTPNDGELTVTGVTSDFNGGELVIPETYHGYVISVISEKAFQNNTDITSVTIPDTVKQIGSYGFDGCSNLEVVNFGESPTLQSLGSGFTFRNCTSLTSFELPASVTSTGTYLFQGCTALETCSFPSSYGSLSTATFSGCTSLKEFTIPDNATLIRDNTFYKCSSLEEITIPSSVTSIGIQAFGACTSLTKVEGLDSSHVETIYQEAFDGCSSLTEITLPSTIKDLSGKDIFYGCSNLETISIPEECEVTSLGDYFAYRCEELTDFTIPSSVTSIGTYAFMYCSSLSGEFIIPDGVTSIGQNTFQYCSSITSIVMGSGVTSIGHNAFNTCSSLVSVVLSDGVSLSNTAFWYCYALTTVYYYGDASSWESLGKGNSNESITSGTATVYYYSATQMENGWHLVNGSPSTTY